MIMRRSNKNTRVYPVILSNALTMAVVIMAFPVSTFSSTQLERYVLQGLRHNLGLKQQRLEVRTAEAATREAFGLMMPSLSVESRYSSLNGNVPDLGELINPAYATLNQLIGEDRFPTDLKMTLPSRQQTGLRLTQPLFAPKALFGYQIRGHLDQVQRARLRTAARDLAASIKTAYLNYAKSVRVVEIYEQTVALLEENLRVTQKLADNQRVTLDVVYRAKAELSDVEQKRSEAARQRTDAARYFNLLLDRPLDEAIVLDPDSTIAAVTLPTAAEAIRCGMDHREELLQIDHGVKAADKSVKLNNSAFLPTVGFAVDYGFQGDDYRFHSGEAVTTFSVVAQWNLFNGGQDAARRQQAVLESQRLTLQQQELAKQIDLQIRQAYDAAVVARQAQATAQDRLQSARRSFELVARRFAEGMASQLEYLDARTSYTSSGLNQIITTYDFVQKYVELERDAALLSEFIAREL